MQIIQEMLDQAKKHNLEMECLITMVRAIAYNKLTDNRLDMACQRALVEWDI